jgi:integrase
MGLVEWTRKRAARGYTLVQLGVAQRTAAAWSKWLNRHLNAKVSDDPQLVLYSLRHSFRQMLRAGNIGDELADKIFGHSTGKVGAEYGRDLSPA